ncbi:hypothetical protein CJF59_13555 [Acetobacter pomorum]|uniref:Uncharacterized protein n=2 Tax=Acetobacter TaxID=434 RepID=A0AAN1UA37_9PROT|nr:hypothetical protein CJF59_13555 [Acetobacter pomorum]
MYFFAPRKIEKLSLSVGDKVSLLGDDTQYWQFGAFYIGSVAHIDSQGIILVANIVKNRSLDGSSQKEVNPQSEIQIAYENQSIAIPASYIWAHKAT